MTHLPSPTEVDYTTGLGSTLVYINQVTNFWASRSFLMAIYAIFLWGYYAARSDIIGAFAMAGFGTFVIGLLFFIGGFVEGFVFSIVIAVMIAGVVGLWLDSR